MKKILLTALFLTSALFALQENAPVSQKIIASKIKIIDIRTLGEWKETGVIKGSIPITFFDERGNYNVPQFLSQLKKTIKAGEKFALICRTGSRTSVLANFLGQNGFNVLNLQGGIMYAKKIGIALIPYQ